VLSICAGDGRDLLGVLKLHPRRADVRARLIELDEGLVEEGRRGIDALGLGNIEFVRADAGETDCYGPIGGLRLVLMCGIFGNLADDDVRRTIEGLPMLLAMGGTAIWTRHRLVPDLTPTIRAWFAAAGFVETAFDTIARTSASVGSNRLAAKGPARPLPPRLFEFIGDGAGGLC
jgi:hypothetical protein